jgi:phosphonate degradation associated HDIG domain protein
MRTELDASTGTPSLREELRRIYAGRATRRYGLSLVSQLQHALQSAARAERAGDPAALIVASLLHDIGHMIHDLGDDPAARGIDDVHEELGARWLAARFDAAVAEPVRLHVAAKRYLCAAEPDYFGRLSADSVRSLALQGGPMAPQEMAAFDWGPHAEAARRLRRYDEAAKDPKADTPGFEHFLRYVDACARR